MRCSTGEMSRRSSVSTSREQAEDDEGDEEEEEESWDDNASWGNQRERGGKARAYPMKLESKCQLTTETYRRWRLQWSLWASEAPCERQYIGRRTMQSILCEEAWEVVQTLDIDTILSPDGGDLIVSLLDEAFDYSSEEELHRAFDEVFDCPERAAGKDVKTYILEHRAAWIKLDRVLTELPKEKPTKGDGKGTRFNIPEELKGYWLLKKVGLIDRY